MILGIADLSTNSAETGGLRLFESFLGAQIAFPLRSKEKIIVFLLPLSLKKTPSKIAPTKTLVLIPKMLDDRDRPNNTNAPESHSSPPNTAVGSCAGQRGSPTSGAHSPFGGGQAKQQNCVSYDSFENWHYVCNNLHFITRYSLTNERCRLPS